ncbi:MAG: hypothetical protein ACR2LK_03110 [Solirubrobacteraceae bacterium]
MRELVEKPGPLLDLGEHGGDVDPWREPVELCEQPHRRGVLIQRVGA